MQAQAAAGLRDVHVHDLRHTFASHFIMRTNDLPALQKLLGHSTPAMTLRYAHLSKGHLASEMAAFESAVPTGLPGRTQVAQGLLHGLQNALESHMGLLDLPDRHLA